MPDLSVGLCHATITTRAEAERIDPLFFPSEMKPGQDRQRILNKEAAALCYGCPVTVECLEYALDNNETGVWGGTTTNQRHNFTRRGRRHSRGVL